MSTPEPERRTKRRYAHELYPHADEYEIRPLTVEVPYLYARAIGFDVWGTNWFDHQSPEQSATRTHLLVEARHKALLADALAQGLTSDEAWTWASERMDESGEWIYERARHHGVAPDKIKPYQCGPEPDPHDHVDPVTRIVTPAEGKESDCPDCTEPATMTTP